MHIQRSNRKIGLSFQGDSASLLVWAPFAKELAILWGNQRVPLNPLEKGYWKVQLPTFKAGTYYQLELDQQVLPDPTSLSQPEGVDGPSQAIDLQAGIWTDQHWTNPRWEDYIIYELHVGTFTEAGTLKAAEDKLEHLVSLGITAVELMPLAQFPGERNWGYDGVFPFAVQQSYGGPHQLQHFVDRCHQLGLAVILDVVYNHIGPEGNYLGHFGPYFTDSYQSPWGKAINLDDAYSDDVRKFFIENALMWLRDFHLDALRLDAVHAMKDFSAYPFLLELREEVNRLSKWSGKTHYLIAESDLNDPRILGPISSFGSGLDAQWNNDFHHAIRVAAGEKRKGYYVDFQGVKDLAKVYRDAYVYDGQYSIHRKRRIGHPAIGLPYGKWVIFSQNHDQVGNRALGERSSLLFSFEMQKLFAAAVLTAPFIPLLFMGEEWGELNPFPYFVDHADPELNEQVNQGRKREFSEFFGEGITIPPPSKKETFLKSKLNWELLQQGAHQTLLTYYRTLIRLRKASPWITQVDRTAAYTEHSEERNTLLVHLSQGSNALLYLMNFQDSFQDFQIPQLGPHWDKRFDSAAPQWNGPSEAPQKIPQGETLSLAPHSFLLYETVSSSPLI